MKTKKISWQAIAIVVLALVLIASIALGVSGAWFQDKDQVTSEATMGNPVTVRLAAMDSENHPSIWSDEYTGKAYPGDKILGETRILLGFDTMSVVRVSISAKIYDGEVKPENEITTANVETKAAASTKPKYYHKTDEEYKTEYKTSFTALNAIMASATVDNTAWTASDGYFYFNELANSATKTTKKVGESSTNIDGLYLFGQLDVPLTVENAAHGWNIVVDLTVEAVQAANLKDGQVPTGWDWSKIPAGLQSVISDHNTGRAPTTGA